jgi:hypothetical protein
VVGNFGTFNSTGAGHTFGASYIWYLAPQGGRRSYVTFGFDDKVFDASKINDVVVARRARPPQPPAVSWLHRAHRKRHGGLGLRRRFAANTGSGEHNDLPSYQSEDPRIDTVHWKACAAAPATPRRWPRPGCGRPAACPSTARTC